MLIVSFFSAVDGMIGLAPSCSVQAKRQSWGISVCSNGSPDLNFCVLAGKGSEISAAPIQKRYPLCSFGRQTTTKADELKTVTILVYREVLSRGEAAVSGEA